VYRETVEEHAKNLVRQLPLPYVQSLLRKDVDPRHYQFRWPDDELSWMGYLVHQAALGAVDSNGGMLRTIISASTNLDAFDPDGLMFDSSETMLKYIALYAYKADLWNALSWLRASDVLALATPTTPTTPPADAGKE